MACLHNPNSSPYICTMFDEESTENGYYGKDPVGWTVEGHCVVEDDECPEDSCQHYESDTNDEEEEY